MALRLVLIDKFPFRDDEAVYGTWALHLLNEDPLFLTVWPDKPPIFIWLISASIWLLGADEVSVRGVNVAASVLTVPVVSATAYRLWGRWEMAASALVFALNPFAIAFAPTGYTDPVLVLCGSMALYFAVTVRPFWAGIWLALAIMTKQQGLLYAPLIFGMLWIEPATVSASRTVSRRKWLWFLFGSALIVLPLVFIDSLRWSIAPSPWDLSIRNYGDLAFVPVSDWWSRTWAWLEILWHFVGSITGWVVLAIALIVSLFQWIKDVTARPWASLSTILLLGWTTGFLLVHITTSVQIWDRYLLPLLPIVALCIGRLWARLFEGKRRWLVYGLSLLSVAILMQSGWHAARGQIPIGGDHGDLDGLHEAMAWLQTEQGDEPYIIYHHSLGSQLRFYLYEEVQQGQAELRWYPHATYLFDNAVKAPHRRKFLLQPDWAPFPSLETQSAARRVQITRLKRHKNFQAFELTTSGLDCDWCLCQEGSH